MLLRDRILVWVRRGEVDGEVGGETEEEADGEDGLR